jgi:hypothetical protein
MRFIVVLILCVSYALPAAGDWQYTRWGMSSDQAMEASKGQLKRCDKICERKTTDTDAARLFGNYQSGEFSFTEFAYFNMQTDKLTSIRLDLLQREKASGLIGAIRNKYGEPSTKTLTAIMGLYVWRDANDQIAIVIGGPNNPNPAFVDLIYQPRITDSNIRDITPPLASDRLVFT